LVAYVKATYGDSPEVLADFGIHPKAPAQLTVEQKAAKAAKSAATREARHTQGSKQKKSVNGDVVAVDVTPIVATKPGGAEQPSSPTGPVTSGSTTATAATRTT